MEQLRLLLYTKHLALSCKRKWMEHLVTAQLRQRNICEGQDKIPFRSSMSAGMIPDLASRAAQESSIETVPIIITTSKTRSSSAEPGRQKAESVTSSKPLVFWQLYFVSIYNAVFQCYASPNNHKLEVNMLYSERALCKYSLRDYFERLINLCTDLVSVYPWGMERVCTLSAQVPNPDLVRSNLQVFPGIQSQILPLHHSIFELLSHQHNPNENTADR